MAVSGRQKYKQEKKLFKIKYFSKKWQQLKSVQHFKWISK